MTAAGGGANNMAAYYTTAVSACTALRYGIAAGWVSGVNVNPNPGKTSIDR